MRSGRFERGSQIVGCRLVVECLPEARRKVRLHVEGHAEEREKSQAGVGAMGFHDRYCPEMAKCRPVEAKDRKTGDCLSAGLASRMREGCHPVGWFRVRLHAEGAELAIAAERVWRDL